MHEIKCPNCGETFKVDESKYAAILSQVRSEEFNREIHDKLVQAEQQYKTEIKLLEEKTNSEVQKKLSEKDSEISSLKNELKSIDKELSSAKETEMAKLESIKNDEINALKISSAEEISRLKTELEKSKTATRLAIAEATTPLEKERDKLKNDLQNKDTEIELRERTLKEKYEGTIQLKDEEIERLKDLKSKLSTKMVGETLEQHCEIEFNKLRATGFQNAYFEKDNKISSSGSKGDYIFKEIDEDENEIISIMFEMKNENETTATKHKNEDFLKELDKDRNEKHCEYAVLVSLLEPDNDLYNTGIVDVSHRFPKMYVIRPQFFIPMITLLRNAAKSSLKYKKELIAMRNQDIDIANFERDMNDWKASWFTTMKNAGKKHKEAIEQIDKAIENLKKTRDALELSDKHLGSAENKLDNLTIKRLTSGNPTMAARFKTLNDNQTI